MGLGVDTGLEVWRSRFQFVSIVNFHDTHNHTQPKSISFSN
jgi:hypothetical protein